jgi:chromosome segregation ATPase
MQKDEDDVVLNEKSMEVLVAKFIPTSQYFESRFDHMQYQIDEIKDGVKKIQVDVDRRFTILETNVNHKFDQVDKRFDEIKLDIDKRFEQVDKRFVEIKLDIDKRFEQVDKRFEQIDKRFEQIDAKLDKLLERIDVKIDRGLAENRAASFRLFSFAMIFSAISMAGLLGKIANLF